MVRGVAAACGTRRSVARVQAYRGSRSTTCARLEPTRARAYGSTGFPPEPAYPHPPSPAHPLTRLPPNPLTRLSARLVIGHRGNRAFAPENTIESFRQAIDLGADALEFDVHATRDGEIVVFHDPTLERTTDGAGAVSDLDWRDLAKLDAGARFTRDGGATFPYRGQGIGIPRLAEVLERFPKTPLLIEIKTRRASPGVRDLLENDGASSRCVVASFQHEALVPFRKTHLAVSASPRDIGRLYLPSLVGRRYDVLPFQVLSTPRVYRGLPVPVRALSDAVRTAGVPVHVWTVNDPRVAESLWARGITGIISDDPAAMIQARRRLSASLD